LAEITTVAGVDDFSLFLFFSFGGLIAILIAEADWSEVFFFSGSEIFTGLSFFFSSFFVLDF
jgi:hypothetical protein